MTSPGGDEAPSLPEGTVPPLRADLVLEEAPGGATVVVDPVRRRRIRLDPRGAALASLMDRPQSRAELRARLESGTGRPMAPDALARVLEAFAGLGLLADAGPAPEDPGLADPATVPLRIDPELRFDCTACGSCCHGVNVPFDRDALARLGPDRLAVLQQELRFTGSPVVVLEGQDAGEALPLCRNRHGACLFLEGALCGLHRRWGADAKPLVCRMFPWEFLRTPDGITVGLQMECRDLLNASRGRPVSEQLDDIRVLLAQAGPLVMERDTVSLDGATVLPWDDYRSLEADVLRAQDAAQGGGYDLWAASGDLLAARCAAAGHPLPVPADPAEAAASLAALLERFSGQVKSLRRRLREEGSDLRVTTANADPVFEALETLRDHPEAVLAADEEGESLRFARLAARNWWAGREALRTGDLVTAQGLAVLRWLLARAMAVHAARRAARRFLTAQDLVDAWVRAHFLTRNRRVRAVLEPLRPEIVRLLVAGLPQVRAGAPTLCDDDVLTEFHLI